jgi:peptidoglycan/LPS O-acetylase OafA/YrhL
VSIDKATTPHTNLVFIDVLRSIAVIGVVAVHTAQWTLSSVKDADGWFAAVSTLLYSGRLGVEVFFFLSGFLLTLLYENKAKSLRSYAAARFFRIWPLWTLFSIVWASYFIISGEATDWVASGFLLSLFFGLWLSPEHYNSFIGGAWSIQIEIVAYIIFWFLKERKVPTIVSVAILINLIGTFVSVIVGLDDPDLFGGIRRLSLQTGLNFFVAGWISSRVVKESGWFGTNKDLAKTPQHSVTLHALKSNWLLLLVWLGTFLLTPAIYGNPIEAIGFLLISIALAAIISRGRKITVVFAYVGRRSYFVFFMHFILLEVLGESIIISNSAVLAMAATPLAIFGVLGTSLALSELSFRFFEKPLMRVARRF